MKTLISFKFNGTHTYGVWKDNFHSLCRVKSISRVPLTPVHIAGIAKVGDRMATIADLSVCMGFPPVSRGKLISILSFIKDPSNICFALESTISEHTVKEECILPVPGFIKTDSIETFAVVNGSIIPVININNIRNRLQHNNFHPDTPTCMPPGQCRSTPHTLWLCNSGNLDYAIVADSFESAHLPVTSMVTLPETPAHIHGFTVYNNHLITLINLPGFIQAPAYQAIDNIVIAGIDNHRFGLPVAVGGAHNPTKSPNLTEIPDIMKTQAIKTAFKKNNCYIPVITLRDLLSPDGDNRADEKIEPHSSPDISYPFSGKKEKRVLEFIIAGNIHAVPEEEVEEWFQIGGIQPFPAGKPMIAGASDFGGRMVPVVDPAVIFGLKTPITTLQGIRIKKDDFSCLVISESVIGVRELPPELQRDIPVEQHFEFVYGCYPHDTKVRLVLNFKELTHHFTSEMTGEFSFAFSSDIPATLNTSPHDIENRPEDLVTSYFPLDIPVGINSIDDMISLFEASVIGASISGTGNRTQTVQIIPKPGIDRDTSAHPARKAGIGETTLNLLTDGIDTVGADDVFVTWDDMELEEASAAELPVQGKGQETVTLTIPEPDMGTMESVPACTSPSPTLPRTVKTEIPEYDTTDTPDVTTLLEKPEVLKPNPETKPGDFADTMPEKTCQTVPDNGDNRHKRNRTLSATEHHKETSRLWPILVPTLMVTALVIVFISYYRPIPQNTPPESNETSINITTIPRPPVSPPGRTPVEKKPVNEIHTTESLPETSPAPMTPPVEMFFGEDIAKPNSDSIGKLYEVIEGDNLWNISKRYTGSGFNYIDIALENQIDNPDLIYPEQLITIPSIKE